MNRTTERRKSERRDAGEPLPPEFLAVLEVCGGEMRQSDRERLTEQRSTEATPQPRPHDRRRGAG